MDVAAPAPARPDSLAARLANVHVGLRADLEVTRTMFRGQAAYIVRDPITFQSQQLSPADYESLVSLDGGKTLRAVFLALVERGRATADDEEAFYEFILHLHRLGFLRLPIADDRQVYRRFQAKKVARRKQILASLMFLRVPLINPDRFLDRTVRYVRPLFSWPVFIVWVIFVASAGVTFLQHSGELAQPLEGVLAARNLPLIWLTLVVLKVFHEFGHAYACKVFGGHVPEMGAYLIMMTPCAYVDATASWGFARKRDRIIVSLAGMYVEIAIAAAAVFVWSNTEASLVRSLAYNVIFLAGTITVLFNINPLMRYDGYYVLSDLVEVPNLRARAAAASASLAKRWFLGVPHRSEGGSRLFRAFLTGFGIAGAMYRVTLVLGIAAVIATKVLVLGLSLAGVYVATSVIQLVRKSLQYMWSSHETARIRWRAAIVTALLVIGLPVGAALIPIPATVRAAGVIVAEQEVMLFAPDGGFVEATPAKVGDSVHAGQALVQLGSELRNVAVEEATARVRAAEIRQDALRTTDVGAALAEGDRVRVAEEFRRHAEERRAALTIAAPGDGQLAHVLSEREIGRFVREGEPVALVVSGDWQVRALLTEEQMAAAKPRPGQAVEFRAQAEPGRLLRGVVSNVAPSGHRQIRFPQLTNGGGGSVVVDPATQEATQAYFEVVLSLPPDGDRLRHGMTGDIRLPAGAEPLATRGIRRLQRFIDKLLAS